MCKLIIILLLFFEIIYSFEFSYSKFNHLLYEKNIRNVLNDIYEDNNKIKIINNLSKDWCKNCFKGYFNNENINLDIISYNDFFNDKYNKKKDIILVDDFMINYGRTLTLIEKNKINKYNKNTNIILNINDYDELVLKDDEFINKYKMYEFPNISKRQINNYIFELIEYYNYHDKLLLINWKRFDIEKLNFEIIEDLIFDIHMLMMTNNDPIFLYEDIIQNKLSFLYKKYYD